MGLLCWDFWGLVLPQLRGDSLSKEGVILWPGIPPFPAATGYGVWGCECTAAAIAAAWEGEAMGSCREEGRQHQTKLGKGQKEGDTDSRGKS